MNTRIDKYDADEFPTVLERASNVMPLGNTRPIRYFVMGSARQLSPGKNEIVVELREYAPVHVRSVGSLYEAG